SAPAKPVQPYYTAGPYLDGYFIFPTTGYNRGKLHAYNAVDISRGSDCIEENIPVYAAASGVATETYPTQSVARWANSGYGNNIILLHPNGVRTRYAHLKEILISAGQYVNQGAIIAYMGGYPGNPGSGNSTGCHLHFEVRDAKQIFAR
ncbi:MAG: M23 family metallopeptidase, partial [Candidatus Azambacteria bacterium]|nr:M23 family metallopeptidase [Candidatus Azambacteria bacterium]